LVELLDKKRYFVNNTCAFDLVAVIISRAYINNLYKKFVDNSSNQFLKYCKALARGNATKIIHKHRMKLIIK